MNLENKLRLTIILILTITILLLMVLNSNLKLTKKPHIYHLRIKNNIEVAQFHCQGTLYPNLCISTLSTIPHLHRKSLTDILLYTIGVTEFKVRASTTNLSVLQWSNHDSLSRLQRNAINDCLELLSDTTDELEAVLDEIAGQCGAAHNFSNIVTFLSTAMTNQYTCLDGFSVGSNKTLQKSIQAGLFNISRLVSNSLVMLKKISMSHHCSHKTIPLHNDDANRVHRAGFPGWMKKKDRRLLQSPQPPGNGTRVDIVVAKDGSGNFKTVGEAVAAAPNGSTTRYVIYIKAGAYYENVEVPKKKKNIMFLGDGMGKTLIKANRSVFGNYTTFRSATLAVVGAGFIAKGITVENYAGPTNHQAVALRSGSDFSAFYECSFIGYQDTLYTHSLRQFYRECDIYGTVDFIFGNSAVVFQNCSLYARIGLPNQKNSYTAQGRQDPNQNTGIVILNSKVAATADLAANKTTHKTYLGRPWMAYSRTVFMYSYIDDVVDPSGWLEWDGDFAISTLFYAEYMNRGPGANTSARVTWPGYRVLTNSSDASNFTVGKFILGGEWLPPYGIPFYLNLTTKFIFN